MRPGDPGWWLPPPHLSRLLGVGQARRAAARSGLPIAPGSFVGTIHDRQLPVRGSWSPRCTPRSPCWNGSPRAPRARDSAAAALTELASERDDLRSQLTAVKDELSRERRTASILRKLIAELRPCTRQGRWAPSRAARAAAARPLIPRHRFDSRKRTC